VTPRVRAHTHRASRGSWMRRARWTNRSFAACSALPGRVRGFRLLRPRPFEGMTVLPGRSGFEFPRCAQLFGPRFETIAAPELRAELITRTGSIPPELSSR
jgi:hypothetical protein